MSARLDASRQKRLADALRAAMDSQFASLAETLEALALVCSEGAEIARPGSVNEASWRRAMTRLFDLAQEGRLYAPLPGEED